MQWLLDHEAAISTSLLAGLLESYPGLQSDYGYDEEKRRDLMPDVSSVEDFRPIIGLHGANVRQVIKEGIPYLGFGFGCTWDDEHGLGVLMHGTRVVEIGHEDSAILLWMAERDAEAQG